MNVYVDLTREFNEGGCRAILSSGQAVVLHRLAIMSKDGDWILREAATDLDHVLRVLSGHGPDTGSAHRSTCGGCKEAGVSTSSSRRRGSGSARTS